MLDMMTRTDKRPSVHSIAVILTQSNSTISRWLFVVCLSENHFCCVNTNQRPRQQLQRLSNESEGHACHARRSGLDNPTLRSGRDKRVPPRGGGTCLSCPPNWDGSSNIALRRENRRGTLVVPAESQRMIQSHWTRQTSPSEIRSRVLVTPGEA
jgi:hypothetical protein